MNFRSFARRQPKIDLTPLIDVVFTLVIFVVLVATFERVRGLDIDLPIAQATNPVEKQTLSIAIPKQGPLQIDGRPIASDSLQSELQLLRSRFRSIVLVADGDAAVSRAVRVLDDARAAGFETVTIAAAPRR